MEETREFYELERNYDKLRVANMHGVYLNITRNDVKVILWQNDTGHTLSERDFIVYNLLMAGF